MTRWTLLLGALALTACGGNREPEVEGEECDGFGHLSEGACVCDDGYRQHPDDPTSCIVDDVEHGDGIATDVNLHLHSNAVKIILATMEVVGMEATEWDLYMSHDDPVDGGPCLQLGPGVAAKNLGSGADYHAVSEAPTDGYENDDPNTDFYVIGSSWRDGGTGTTGFHMTENVYAIKLADVTYAKVEVLSAQTGEVHVLCYRQPDGSQDISTHVE
ncbi:MAG: hypothetical protein JXR83_00965 [Deltaproteobacteria bacterium]|nr:hypothetical protein [Deltaproteobacteria bacterium]